METLRRPLMLISAVVMLWAGAASAQPATPTLPNDADVVALQNEVTQLRDEVQSVRRALTELTAMVQQIRRDTPGPTLADISTGEFPPDPARPPQPVVSEPFDVVRAQIDELAQTRVESASKFPVKLSGTILSNFYANSGRGNWLENPNLVEAEDANPAGSASATVRQSRVGFEVTGIEINKWQVSGAMVVDFFGGTPNFQTGTIMGLPRLIYAFARAQTDRTAIQFGQDHVILAPRDPTSLAAFSFPLLFRSGNLYLRAPQARIEQRFGSWSITGGIVAPVAGDASRTFEFAPVAGAGERSKRPAVASRVAFARGDESGPGEINIGVSGHYGWRRAGATVTDAWAAALDFAARAGIAGVSGEYFIAENAEPFGGGISQGGRSAGGWIEGRIAATARTRFIAGAGIDQPEDRPVLGFRTRNRTLFGSTIIDLTPEVAVSLEYRWMTTRLRIDATSLRNHHFNAAIGVKF